jgi:hypothetical protein
MSLPINISINWLTFVMQMMCISLEVNIIKYSQYIEIRDIAG